MNNKIVKSLLFSIIIIAACGNPTGTKEQNDTPTSGHVNIVVDESYSLLFDTELYVFHSLYENAHVHAKYAPAKIALKSLFDDSAKVAVLTRPLTNEEKKSFEEKNIFPQQVKIADDAIAFVLNKENVDTNLTFQQIKNILEGKDSVWTQINTQSNLNKIQLIFDNPNSANADYIAGINATGKLPKNSFAVQSNKEVIEYVANNKGAIGVVSVNWISDKDDSTTIRFLQKINVVGISKQNSTEKYYKPYQAYIKTKDYPFCREVYMVNRQTRAGLGMGFVSFVAGEKGQRIILKMGMVPAITPTRLVQIK